LSSAPPAPAAATSNAPSVPRAKRSASSYFFSSASLISRHFGSFSLSLPPQQAPARENKSGLLYPTGITAWSYLALPQAAHACGHVHQTNPLAAVERPSAAPAYVRRHHHQSRSTNRPLVTCMFLRYERSWVLPFTTRSFLKRERKRKKRAAPKQSEHTPPTLSDVSPCLT
jgi:hypothetical protein